MKQMGTKNKNKNKEEATWMALTNIQTINQKSLPDL
jgi:hypothetical protein